ncbi:MAG: polyprenyl synthetase family protein [Acidobacteriota bacterium]
MEFDRYLAECARLVERYLDRYLPPEDTYPATIHRAVRYSLFAGGKRLRPVLVLAAADAVGGRREDALPAAAAVEMIHTYSLIHDDLPAMDNDALRRGKPTSHVVFGEAVAILAGDALVTHAFHLMASASVGEPSFDKASANKTMGGQAPAFAKASATAGATADKSAGQAPAFAKASAGQGCEQRLHAVAVLAEAAGIAGLIGGQVVDLESEGQAVGAETLEYIHRHKTGALMGAAAHLGALLGGGTEENVERLTRFGEEIGLAFQIVDDILDLEGDTATLGKAARKDREAGKLTYPEVHGIDGARRRARELAEEAIALIAPLGPSAEPLACLARRVVERRA